MSVCGVVKSKLSRLRGEGAIFTDLVLSMALPDCSLQTLPV